MNWDAIGAVGEIVGAVAVIATLVYLAIQIRDSARASRSAAVTDATTAMQAFYQELGSNPQSSQLFLNGLTKPDSLSREDEFQYLMLMHSCFLGFQRSFFLAQEGTLDVELRDSIGTAVNAANHLPGMRLYWKQRRAFFQPEFVTWVESLLRRQSLSDMRAYKESIPGGPLADSDESD
jgi:hypothetical protein